MGVGSARIILPLRQEAKEFFEFVVKVEVLQYLPVNFYVPSNEFRVIEKMLTVAREVSYHIGTMVP